MHILSNMQINYKIKINHLTIIQNKIKTFKFTQFNIFLLKFYHLVLLFIEYFNIEVLFLHKNRSFIPVILLFLSVKTQSSNSVCNKVLIISITKITCIFYWILIWFSCNKHEIISPTELVSYSLTENPILLGQTFQLIKRKLNLS